MAVLRRGWLCKIFHENLLQLSRVRRGCAA